MVNYIYKGYGITNENGIAKLEFDENGDPIDHSYTGVGAGEIDFVASLDNPITSGSLVSENHPVYDTLFYDVGTDDSQTHYHNNSNNVQISCDDTGKTLLNSTTSSKQIYLIPLDKTVSSSNIQEWDCDFAMELDFVANTGTGYLQVSDGTQNFHRSWVNLGLSGGEHIRWEIGANSQKIFIDDNTSPSFRANYSFTSKVMIRFVLNANGGTYTFKNFMIYPI